MSSICASGAPSRAIVHLSSAHNDREQALLADAGWRVERVCSLAELRSRFGRAAFPVGLVDLPKECPAEYLHKFVESMEDTDTVWIAHVMPGQTEDESIRRFILEHCFDFVTAPCAEERLTFALGHAYGLSTLRRSHAAPDTAIGKHGMIGECDAMLRLYREIERCAPCDAPVFISGESGTGKELAALAIHTLSSRATRPHVAINCAAVPATLLQSELFGHERGAFTGAAQRKIGRVEAAHGGTLFLDEIGDMPIECQAVLLRFLQEGTIERLGGTESIKVDVRIISATHVDLDAAVRNGRFRADLYHRLCVLRLKAPPLRERGSDIKLLASYALSMFRQDNARRIRGFRTDAIGALCNYAWPGNVRELLNCVRRAIVMADGRFITAGDLGLPDASPSRGLTLAEVRARAEIGAIDDALRRHGHNLSGAAADLGVSRATLYRIMNGGRAQNDAADSVS
ncbi:sigma-54 dependent transcriptional regulator [Paraburkholderia phosphatilytica]|uniref:sigma-54 dependent transcriptional regulator n=1 Tax=Paraburkholderia phosphatilytica TaxID=2282883 RepID=UPI000E4BE771|nr:sigma-54 dependent transcriptional regulator [Paraburkholderia phosphatilytica]